MVKIKTTLKILVKNLKMVHENAYLLSLFLAALEKTENPFVFFLLHNVRVV
jgi:hypothetical protein